MRLGRVQGKLGWVWAMAMGAGCASAVLHAQQTAGTPVVRLAGSAASAALPASAPSAADIFPLAQIHRGLSGVAYTVFEGVTPEPMALEILGVLKDAIGPGQDMILARLMGEKPEYTGVVAGMSGSPVYIGGRLVGALSYRIGQFSKEPICGITPIEQMFEVRDGRSAGMRLASDRGAGKGPAASAFGAAGSTASSVSGGGGEVQPIETALVFGGFSQEAVARFGEGFRAMGMTPVAGLGGAAAAGTKQPEPIVPGSAVSAVLVRGDLSISGTCTVTYVDANQLLACGHPITQFGPVSMPMTKAEVVATLASPLNAFKIINTTETVGSFTEDRASAILGRFHTEARMIPVSVDILPAASQQPASAGVREASIQLGLGQPTPEKKLAGMPQAAGMHFEVLDNRELTPQAMLVSVYQSLSGTNQSANDLSFRMTGELTLKGLPAVKLEGMMAPSEFASGAISSAMFVNERFSRLYSNAEEQPEVTGLHLRMESIAERRSAVLEGARLGQTEIHAGDTIEVEATLHPYQADARVVRLKVKLPESLQPGLLRMVISDGATLDRLAMPNATGLASTLTHPLALVDAVAQMNRMHANDRIYVTLLDHTAQAALDAESLPDVPLSMVNVIEPLRASQKMQLTGESVVEVGSTETGYAVTGSQVLTVTVR